jgi:putative transposase
MAKGRKSKVDELLDDLLEGKRPEEVLGQDVDGLKGFPEALAAVYPRSQVQLCIVHMVRNCLR